MRLTYRREEGAEDRGFGPPGFAFRGAADALSDDARFYGYAIAPDLLLVPQPIPDALVRRIEQVTIEDEGDPVIEASYEGRVRGTGAFVVKLVGATLEAARDGAGGVAAGRRPRLPRAPRDEAGAAHAATRHLRPLGRAWQPGYGDRRYLASEQTVPVGAFLLDLDGRVFGVATELRPEDAERGGAPPGAR